MWSGGMVGKREGQFLSNASERGQCKISNSRQPFIDDEALIPQQLEHRCPAISSYGPLLIESHPGYVGEYRVMAGFYDLFRAFRSENG